MMASPTMPKNFQQRLIDAGLVSGAVIEQANRDLKLTGYALADYLLDLGVLPEPEFLRFLAGEFQTRFVSPKKLSMVTIATEVLERSGELAGAIDLLKSGIAQLPDPGVLYNRLAVILLAEKKDFAAAEGLLRRALAFDPDNEVYMRNLMKVLAGAAASERR